MSCYLHSGCITLAIISCLFLCTSVNGTVVSYEKSLVRQKRTTKTLANSDINKEIHKRQSGNENSCVAPDGFVKNLDALGDSHYFRNDGNPSISLTWSGTNGVIIALTTMNGIISGPSKLYRSINRGKSFVDISSQILSDNIRKTNGILVSPVDSKMIILVGYDTRFSFVDQHTNLYITRDAGEKFDKHTCPFKLDPTSLIFNPKNKNRLLAKSLDSFSALWLSLDFGQSWNTIQHYVAAVHWDNINGDVFFFTMDPHHKMEKNSLDNELYRHTISSDESTLIAQHVHSFAVQNDFLFVSVQFIGQNTSRVMHVSRTEGHSWNAAQLPLINPEQFYSILDMSENMVFVHVDKPGDSGNGDIYTSDERGIVYSLSLTKHLYPNTGRITDFYKVASLNGVYMTSQMGYSGTVHSLISFNKGGTWETINAPEGSVCPKTEKVCNLQIHNYFSASKQVVLPALPLSSVSTIGIILAHGNIGDGLNRSPPNVYVTTDGGYSWNQPPQLVGPHYYGIGDAGGLLYAVEASSTPTNILKFSLDEGQCWHSYNFTATPIHVTGVSAEPGEKSADVSIWGWDSTGEKPWIAIVVDFDKVLGRPCSNNDYQPWLAHSSTKPGDDDGCQLGAKTSYVRRKKGTICRNGDQLDPTGTSVPCFCQKAADFMCDYGYMRVKEDCVRDPNAATSNMDICIDGEEERIVTQGYRKIPGDKCQKNEPDIHIETLKKSCAKTETTKDEFGVATDKFEIYTYAPHTHKTSNHTGLIVVLVLTVLGLGSALVYVLHRRRRNVPKIRYTPLSQDEGGAPLTNSNLIGTSTVIDDDDEAVIVDIPADNQQPRNGAIISYHDDSDEDLLVT